MTSTAQPTKDEVEALYQRYGKSLEAANRGQYVAIFPDGQTVLAPTHLEVAEKALETFGRGSFIFKIGEKAVGRWR